MSRARKILLSFLAVGVLAVGGVFAWIVFLRDDAPPALDAADLDEALGAPTDTTIEPDVTDSSTPDQTATTPYGAGPDTTVGTGATTADVAGSWVISGDSTLGYRVQEVLGGVDAEGAGRTNDVTGSLTIDGTTATAAEFTVQMASITSDSDRRDGQFRNRIMSTDDFPTSTFVLSAPIDFGAIPADGELITASAAGDLTLRGVTRKITFELQAQIEGGRIGVLGNIPVLFSDYEIPDPSNGFAVVKDNGLLEFVLVFDRA